MLSASESRAALELVTTAAVTTTSGLLGKLSGPPAAQRAILLEAVPELIEYFSDGTSTLGADFYDDAREAASAPRRFLAEPVILDRTEKIRRGIAWSTEPLFEPTTVTVESRLSEIVQTEVRRPYRDTITTNRQRDPEAVGWRRVAHSGCGFCRMLASRGAVYRSETARFASHGHCNCGAEPVFTSNDTGEEASAMQYLASKRSRTAAQRAELRSYLDTYFPDH